MRTVRRLFYRDIVSAVAFVALAFLSLFFFIDFVDELGDTSSRRYGALHAALYSLLQMPGHLYELAPIAVLIAVVTLSQLPTGPAVGAAAAVLILGSDGVAATAAAGVLLTVTGTAGGFCFAAWAGADRLWTGWRGRVQSRGAAPFREPSPSSRSRAAISSMRSRRSAAGAEPEPGATLAN